MYGRQFLEDLVHRDRVLCITYRIGLELGAERARVVQDDVETLVLLLRSLPLVREAPSRPRQSRSRLTRAGDAARRNPRACAAAAALVAREARR